MEAIEGRISDDCWGCNIAHPLSGERGVSAFSNDVESGTVGGSCNGSGAIIVVVAVGGCSFRLRRLLTEKIQRFTIENKHTILVCNHYSILL